MVSPGRRPPRLRKFRRINRYSQKEVATELGMKDTATISKWESGKVIPSLDNLMKLAILYHTLIEELYFDHWVTMKNEVLKPAERVRIINLKNQKP